MTRRFPAETLGQRIARLRAGRGWTQQQLADRIAASRVAVSHFEMGLAMPSERTVVLLAGLFRIEPHALIADTQYPEAKIDKLPPIAPRYSEVELQLALLERDLIWATRIGPDARRELAVEWRSRLEQLHAASVDISERGLLEAALLQVV